MTSEIRDILTNREVIAIDQDRLGRQATRELQAGATEVWTRPLENRSMAIALFNRGDSSQRVSFKWAQLGMKAPIYLRDVWSHTDRPVNADGFDAEIPSHGSILLRAQWSNN
jgi:alpha-galactosidase